MASFIYVTVSNKAEARKIGRALVRESLCACVNIIENMTSIYRWKGKIENSRESILLVKSSKKNFASIKKRILELHSYENPCIVEIPWGRSSKKYLNWVQKNGQA